MKKKMILVFVLSLFILVGCGSQKATVVDNEGKQSQFTAQELLQENIDNSVRFEKLYKGAKINIEGKVESIVDTGMNICVKLEGDWAIVLYYKRYYEGDISKNFKDVVASLNKGDNIRYNGSISMAGTNCGPEDTLEINIDKDSVLEVEK